MKSDKSAIIHEKARTVMQKCESLKTNEVFFLLQRNLEYALAVRETDICRPVIITIIGGTGAGKSFIFSTLCSTPEISPSSSSVRGFTRKLFISATDEDQKLFSFSNDAAQYLPGLLPGAVLIDTPDLDTIDGNNARLAQETIALSDIIICVTTPDKRANFSIHRNIVEWASRKRWFFVINKTDTAGDVPIDRLKSELAGRLATLGFAVSPAALFAFSARESNSSEFNRFREVVFSQRTLAQSHILRDESETRRILHAISCENTDIHLRDLFQQLCSFRDNLKERINRCYEETITSPAITGMAQDALRTSIYRELSGNASCFLFPYFAIINWLAPGVSAELTESTARQAVAGNLTLANCYLSERMFLEDNCLPTAGSRKVEIASSQDNHGDLFLQIVREAQIQSETALMRFYLVVGNILPLLVMIQTLYRSVASWANGVWLPTDFFIHAVFLLFVSTVPGYLLTARALTRITSGFVLKPAQQAAELQDIEENIAAIDKVRQELTALEKNAGQHLEMLQRQLPENTYGISTRNEMHSEQ